MVWRRFWWVLVVVLLLLVVPVFALADVPARTPPSLVLPQSQVWTVLIGGIVPLVTYVINRVAPWVSEPIKALVLAVAAAAAGALYTALGTHVFGWNANTLQLVLTAVLAAFVTHMTVWKPSGVAAKLTTPRPAP